MALQHKIKHARKLLLAGSLSVTAMIALTVPTTAAGAPEVVTGTPSLTVGPIRTIWPAAAGQYASFPAMFDAGVTRADGSRAPRHLVTFGTGADVGGNPTVLIESTNNGTSWVKRDLPPTSVTKTAAVVNTARLADAAGTIVSVEYEPASASGTTFQFRRWAVGNPTWTALPNASITAWSGVQWLRFQRGLLLLGDARTLVGTMYGVDAAGQFTVFVRSTDGGATWSSGEILGRGWDFNEANLSLTSDDRLMVWMRRNVKDDWTPDLYYRHSTTPDGSGTWSDPVRMAGDTGNSPGSILLGNGAALQGSGRPGNVLRVKYSGISGWTDWTGRITIYNNAPPPGSGPGLGGRPAEITGSSGTVAMAAINGDTALVVGDNCGGEWGCAYVRDYPHGNSHFLWATTATVNPGHDGRLNLGAMFRGGQLTYVNPAFTGYGSAASPRQSLGAYAFDGDVRNDSSVVTTNRSVTLRLDRAYSITGVGAVAALKGTTDLKIEISTNGTTWSTPARGARNGIVRPFTAPVSAQYVRISDPNPTGSAQAFLNELQLYTG